MCVNKKYDNNNVNGRAKRNTFIRHWDERKINPKKLYADKIDFEIRLIMTYDVSPKLLPRWVINKRGDIFWPPKRSPDFPVLTPERSDNKFFSRNDSMVPRCVLMLKGVLSPMNKKCKINFRYCDERS